MDRLGYDRIETVTQLDRADAPAPRDPASGPTRFSVFNSYPLLARDRRLDSIRTDPGLAAFLAEAKARWEHFKAEFEAEAPAR